MKINFTKAASSGNDFVIVDNRQNAFGVKDVHFPELAKACCGRKFSIGADGLLVLEDSGEADFKMRIFNPDGSEAEMCGNGIRASALYASINKWCAPSMKIETLAGILQAEVKDDAVRVKMTLPADIRLELNIGIGNRILNIHSVNTGVPHAVHFVESLKDYAVKEIGLALRHHKLFKPEGTNADFVEVIDTSTISVRTYERGVEDETLACGTGVVAAVVISNLTENVKSPVNVITKSGDILKVYFKKEHDSFRDVFLEGKAHIVFEGGLDYV